MDMSQWKSLPVPEQMENHNQEIFVFGASGHAKVVIDIIEKQQKFRIGGIVDDDPDKQGKIFHGYEVLGSREKLLQLAHLKQGIIAVGNNHVRKKIAAWLSKRGFSFVAVIHPAAEIGKGVEVDGGTVIMPGAIINADSHIGPHAIINTKASIDHDCLINGYTHIAPGTTLCGTVSVGDGTLIGAGAVILPNLKVGSNVTVGAGTVVKQDVSDNTVDTG